MSGLPVTKKEGFINRTKNPVGHIEIAVFLLVNCLFLSSCGGGSINPNTNTGSDLITVSLVQSGTTTSVYAGTSAVNLTASVANDSTKAGVTWNLSPVSSCGTLTTSAATAVYTPPPATLTNSCSVTVTAISLTDGTKSAAITFSIAPIAPTINVAVAQSGSTKTLDAGSSAVTLTATVTNDLTNAGVVWSLTPASGCGTLTSSGMMATYAPPAEPSLNSDCIATATATSVANNNRAASIAFNLKAVAIVLSQGESSTPKVAASGAPITLSASVGNDVSGASNLNWTISGSSSSSPQGVARSQATIRTVSAVMPAPLAVASSTCGTLSDSTGSAGSTITGSVVIYTPPSAGPCTAVVSASTSVNPNVIQVFTISVNATLAITTSSLATGTYAGAYTSRLVALGGIAPYTWTATNLPPGLTITSDGLLSGTPTSAGSYSPLITVRDSGTQASLAQQNFALAVSPKGLTVTGLSTSNKVYDGTAADMLSGNAVLSGVVPGDVVSLGATPIGSFASPGVGTAIAVNITGLALAGSSAGNYSLAPLTGLTANITPAMLTVSGLAANTKVYDGKTTATLNFAAATLNGVIGSDNVTLATTGYSALFATQNVGSGLPVAVSNLGLSGIGAANYTLTQPTGLTANITPATLTVRGLSANNKVYDGTTAVTLSGIAALSGVIGADAVTLMGTPAGAFVTPGAGTAIAVNVSGLSLAGSGAGNYTLAPTTGVTANITPAMLTLTGLSSSNKVYDGTTVDTLSGSAVLSGVVPGDAVSVVGTPTGAFASPGVGTTIAVNVSGLSVAGTSAGNYALAPAAGLTANITPATLTVSSLAANTKVYDGKTTATLNFAAATLNGIIGSDNVTLATTGYSAMFASQNVASGLAVTVSNLGLSGSAAGNYTLTQPGSLTANITPAALTVTADHKTLAQGCSQLPTLTASYSGFVNGETAMAVLGTTMPALSTTATCTSAIGDYPITVTQGTLAAANYTFAFVNGTLTITGKGAAIKLSISSQGTTTAGIAFSVAVIAQDGGNNVAPAYVGTVHFTSSDGQAVLPADYTFTAADAGVHTFVNSATLKTAGNQSITGTDAANSISGTESGIVVNAAAAAKLVLSGFTSPTTAGVGGNLTVTTEDAFNNVAKGYVGTVHFTASDSQAVLPGDYTFTAADAGVHVFSATLKTAGTQSITGTDTANSLASTQSGIIVNAAAAGKLVLSGFPSPTTVGAAGNFTVTAEDAFNNVAKGYVGTVHFTASDSQAVLPGDYTFTAADAGMHVFSATLKTAGTQSITGTDAANSISGTESGIVVNAAVASKLVLSGFPSPTTAGVAGNFTVAAEDAFNNTVKAYVGTVHFASSDGQAVLPADYTFTAADGGMHTFSATLKTAATQSMPMQSITGTDAANSISGTDSGIVVNAAAATTLVVGGFPSATVAGAADPFTVTAEDVFNNVAKGYVGTVHFTSSDGQGVLPADYTFTATDAGVHGFSATLKTVGTQTVTATDTVTSSISGTSISITVTAPQSVSGTITQLGGGGLAGATLTLSPGGQTTTTDANGNYNFASVASGSYTLTPSFTFPTGSDPADSAVFYPSSLSLNVTQNLTEQNFNSQLAFTVKGTVTYPSSGLSSGINLQTYVRLQNPNCSSCAITGTSVLLPASNGTASKAFTIHGVYPGALNATAWVDVRGYATPNVEDPTASNSITVSNADVTGVTLALADPAPAADPGTAPAITVSNINNGVMISYKPILVNGVEQASRYELNWSNQSFSDCEGASTPPGSPTAWGFNLGVGGDPLPENSGRVIILDGNAPLSPFVLTPVPPLGGIGTTYFFCMRGVNSTGPFATWATASSKFTTGPSTGISTNVPVTIPSGVTTSGVPLYAGCFSPSTNQFYAASDEAPTVGTNSLNVLIPSGTTCYIFALLDLDQDGLGTPINPFPAAPFSGGNSGDIFNLGRDFTTHTITTVGTIPVDLTPYKGDTRFALATQHTLDQNSVESFGVNFDVSSLQNLPTAVELQSPSANLNSLLDFASCTNCGQGEFNQTLSTDNVPPSGSYTVKVTNENVPVPAAVSKTASVTGVNSAFTTSLAASGGGTPTFTWSYPANPANNTYELIFTDQNGNVIWQVPAKPSGFNSTAITAGTGFPSTVTSIVWGTDPTGDTSNVPTLSTLPSGTYNWSLTTIDSNGNRATQKQVYSF